MAGNGFFQGRPVRASLVPAAVSALVLFGCIGTCTGYPCVPIGVRYGLWLDQCPASDLRLRADVDASQLVREQWGWMHVNAYALWVEGDGPSPQHESERMSRGVGVDLALVREDGSIAPGLQTKDAEWGRGGLGAQLRLPSVPDGDYRLRTTLTTGFETLVLDSELPLYAPALVHVMSDRPLYKPGQEVLLRAAVLRRTDSAPIDQRPGRWIVRSPDGTEMLKEKAGTGAWGVSSTTFPLDQEAEVGTWTAEYVTGSDRDAITFDVRPFKLPRFTVEVTPSARWYRVGDDVVVEGTARYTSGAPVANAGVELSLAAASGLWPMPLAWEEPRELVTDRQGRFRLELGEVPADLLEQSQIRVRARVTDEAGETAVGGGALKLSQDGLVVTAVTELGDGLVEGMNNRAYVRVTTPDGRPVRSASLTLKNPYDPAQPERTAETDEDGVAALQLDPGAPITIVDPPPPVRPRPLTPAAPALSYAQRAQGEALDLEERRALDRAHPAIAACGVHTVGGQRVPVGLHVDASGGVRDVVTGRSAIERCVEAGMRGLRFPAGEPRTYQLTWQVPDTLQPHLQLAHHEAAGDTSDVEAALDVAAVAARRCLPRGAGIDGAEVFELHWTARAGSPAVVPVAVERPGTGLSPAALACVRQALGSARLDEAPEDASMGATTVTLSVPQPPGTARPRATTRTGYEFRVAAVADAEDLGTGRLVFPTGSIPNMRLRATPSLAGPGDTVKVELFRGPHWSGALPEELLLQKGVVEVAKAKFDEASRSADFTIPADAEGFLHVQWAGARTVIFVRPDDALQVALSTDAPTYRPGDTARLTVQTTAGDDPTSAAVSLAGVDQTLSQLAPLLDPDDWGRITVRTTGEDVFGSFGPRALQLGQIQGENAAKAVVLKVEQLPMDSAGDLGVSAHANKGPDEVEALTVAFYRGLEGLVAKARAWEASAPAGEMMTPERCAALWNEVLDEASDAGRPLEDAWGRRLRLGRLPQDLLAQTDPRQVVADSTRLPEDVANWPAWVLAEEP